MTVKLRPMSDLHLEFHKGNDELFPIPYIGEDYLILAGDIQAGTKKKKWFKRLLEHRDVIYILGNHEYYGENFATLKKDMQNYVDGINKSAERHDDPGRLHLLQDNYINLPNIVIFGATLWTRIPPHMEVAIARTMNDYQKISYNLTNLKVSDINKEHEQSRFRMEKFVTNIKRLSPNKKIVIVSHHAPSEQSCSGRYKGDIVNYAYSSDMSHLFNDVDLWIHGHIHNSSDYKADNCRVICNPRGYEEYSLNENFNKDLIGEI